MAVSVISFSDAIHASSTYKKKHLILGNGFSIACIPTIFSYNSLFKEADFSDMPEVQKVFSELGTTDFEVVVKVLEYGSKVLPIYTDGDNDKSDLMQTHAMQLKERLIETIAKNHPNTPDDIPLHKFEKCQQFLANFLNTKGYVFYLNYDLLLYWTLMHSLDDPRHGLGGHLDPGTAQQFSDVFAPTPRGFQEPR
jgi:hypothetical protein